MKWASFILAFLLAVTGGCAATRRVPDADSFALVMTQAPIIDCRIPGCIKGVATGSGSGTVFWQDDNGTWVLTAGHVCANAQQAMGEMMLMSNDGELRPVRRWVLSNNPDLCVILTEDTWGVPVNFSAVEPRRGDKVWSQAAPRGIFMAGAPLLFEGTWSGVSKAGNVIVTMPCAPGSSGSSLLNERGEIVGVVHSTALNFGEIAIATQREAVIKFVDAARDVILGVEPIVIEADPPESKLPL